MDYIIHEAALDRAIAYSRSKFAHQVQEDLMRSLIRKIEDKRSRNKFLEAVRFALNELKIFDEQRGSEKRAAYRSAVTKYYAINSGIARKSRALRKKKPAATVTALPKKIPDRVDGNGQYFFEI